jgi:hypothetical protein
MEALECGVRKKEASRPSRAPLAITAEPYFDIVKLVNGGSIPMFALELTVAGSRGG